LRRPSGKRESSREVEPGISTAEPDSLHGHALPADSTGGLHSYPAHLAGAKAGVDGVSCHRDDRCAIRQPGEAAGEVIEL
jgi:hypothetical protein